MLAEAGPPSRRLSQEGRPLGIRAWPDGWSRAPNTKSVFSPFGRISARRRRRFARAGQSGSTELQDRIFDARRALRNQAIGRCAMPHRPDPSDPRRERPIARTRWLVASALCLFAAGCTSDARMGALRADMAGRQAAAEAAASRPGASEEEKERARGYASAQSCIDQIQAHGKAAQATHMATTGAMAAVSFAGPGGALAARALAPVGAAVTRNQAPFSVACY